MESFITFFTQILGQYLSKESIVFILSIMPIIELRGGLIAASLLKIPYVQALCLAIIGNILPIPFVLFFFSKLVLFLESFSYTKPIANWFRKKVDANRESVEKYDFWGLALFVGIPLPGTGAWTGAMVASLLKMDRKKPFIDTVERDEVFTALDGILSLIPDELDVDKDKLIDLFDQLKEF